MDEVLNAQKRARRLVWECGQASASVGGVEKAGSGEAQVGGGRGERRKSARLVEWRECRTRLRGEWNKEERVGVAHRFSPRLSSNLAI